MTAPNDIDSGIPDLPSIFQAMHAYTVTAINSIILCNGAAAAAVLAFIGSVWGNPEIAAILPPSICAAKLFAVGVGCGMFAAGFGYLTQTFQQGRYATADNPTIQNNLVRAGFWCEVVGVILALAGMFLFIIGAWWGLDALASARGG